MLSRLLPQVGINWVKVPVWFDANDPRRGDELIRFVELLGASNIEVVGIIDRPPAGGEAGRPLGSRELPIAELLSHDLDLVGGAGTGDARLSLRVRWWQLGRDDDTSFSAYPGLNKRIDELRTQLFRFGQDVSMGMSWDWESAQRRSRPGQLGFQQLCIKEHHCRSKKFAELLAKPRNNSALHWVMIEPPAWPNDDLALDEADTLAARSSEFVRRLVAAKVPRCDQIIVSNPFNDEHGLMHANGMPAELLLPWRTTAAMLGGAKYLGQMQLPAGSENRIFHRPDGQVVMVVWNHEPTREVLYLGDNVQPFDIGAASLPRRPTARMKATRNQHDRRRSQADIRARPARSDHALAHGRRIRTHPGAEHQPETASQFAQLQEFFSARRGRLAANRRAAGRTG